MTLNIFYFITINIILITYYNIQPGGKKSLLLHSILENTQPQQKHKKIIENQTINGGDDGIVKKKNKLQSNKIDFKGKRKNLPMLARQLIETQQKDVMDMYKTLKKNKRLSTVNGTD